MSTIADAIEKCDFSRRLEMCSTSNFSSSRSIDVTVYDWIYVMTIAELIGPIITFPVISAIGFVLNIITLKLLLDKNNKAKYFKDDKIFEYLKYNSAFNAIECLISSFTLISECLGRNSIYCSSIQRNHYVQLFKIIFVQYVGESMKTCSIVTLLAFSIQRYIQATNSKTPLATRFNKINTNRFIIVFVILSLF